MNNTTNINFDDFFSDKNRPPFHTFIWLGKTFIEIAVSNISHSEIETIRVFEKEEGNIRTAEAINILQEQIVQKAAKVFIGLESNKYTLVPDSLYDPKELEAYIKALYHLEPLDKCAEQKISAIKARSIFTLKEGTKTIIDAELNGAKIYHAPSALLFAYKKMLDSKRVNDSFIRMNENEIFISIYRNEQLQLHQNYTIENIDDALYHYLNALKLLKIDAKKTSVSLLGRHQELEKLKNILSQNLKSAKHIKQIPSLKFAAAIDEKPQHHFFNLFSLLLCE